MSFVPQRVRDPLHNLIEFGADEFDDAMWAVIQTNEFQRLRRIKQLGFSELVYPGATHTRFAHSLGVFQTARLLIERIKLLPGVEHKLSRERIALAAALVHDVGHGPFSHAFEAVGKTLNLKLAKHENVSDILIRDSGISEALDRRLGRGFSSNVADVIKSEGPKDIYAAVVSSQFDADRLDYMRRDRLMCGTQHGAIDFGWLLSNLEVGQISVGVDDEATGYIETLVLGPKAIYAAETYLLSLFQLYPTVYFHKATRGAEVLFSALVMRIFQLTMDDNSRKTGLPGSHPWIKFANAPSAISSAQALDDTSLWGALEMLVLAEDRCVALLAERLKNRHLYKARDVFSDELLEEAADRDEFFLLKIQMRLTELLKADDPDAVPEFLIDRATRPLYRTFKESKGPLNQIMLKTKDGLADVSNVSNVIRAIRDFDALRVYYDPGKRNACKIIDKFAKEAIDDIRSKY